MSSDDSGAYGSKAFPSLNEDDVLISLIDSDVNGNLETGSRFYGRLQAFNDKLILLRGTDGRRILIKRKMIARLEAE